MPRSLQYSVVLILIVLCSDAENGTISAILDLNERELYISGVNADIQNELLLPGAASLAGLLKDCLTSNGQSGSPSLMNPVPQSPAVGKGNLSVHPSYCPLHSVLFL
jgi:hypothetical protein